MKASYVLFICLAAMCLARAAEAAEIVIPDSVIQSVQQSAAKLAKIVPVDTAQLNTIRANFRTWASRSIDLNKATRRVSPRLNRTSFTLEVTKDVLRLPEERLQTAPIRTMPTTRPRALNAVARPSAAISRALPTVTLAAPVRIVYREGPQYLRFQKLKEAPAKKPLSASTAVSLAKSFIAENRFVRLTSDDQIGQAYVQNRRIAEEKPTGGEVNYLVQQDVVIERRFQGLPVINSKIVVGMYPDTRDILLFKHFNWAPVREQQARTLSPQEMRISSTTSAQEIRNRLQQRIAKVSGGKFRRAEVTQVIPGWFQTADSLVPVIAFEVEVQSESPAGTIMEPYIEVINLAGPDEALMPNMGQRQAPTMAR